MTCRARRIANRGRIPGDAVDVTCDVVVVGAGAAGIVVASSLLRRDGDLEIAVIDPADHWQRSGRLADIGIEFLDVGGVRVVGEVPSGLPPLTVPAFDVDLWRDLALSALLISVIGFVESVSVARTLAAKRRQRIVPDQELVGLGAANLGAAFTGGFARSVVSYEAGAVTPAAGMLTAAGIALATVFLTPLLHHLPEATLAATIVVAVLSLVDLKALGRTWRYSKSDFAAMLATIVLTLTVGVETGVVAGVVLMCPAVNDIDASALESPEAINERLRAGGVTLHLCEVKGPVMDRLEGSHFLDHLSGRVLLSQHDAVRALAPGVGSEAAATRAT